MVVVALTVSLHVAVLLPVAGTQPGDHPLLDTGTDFVGAVCVAAMLWLRSRLEPRDRRRLWRCLSAAVLSYVLGTLVSMASRGGLLPDPAMAGAFIGWGLFYLLGYAAVVDLLRQRVARFHASMWLDGAIAGLAVAAYIEAFMLDQVVEAARAAGADLPAMVRALAFPIADLLQVALLVGVLTAIGRSATRCDWILTTGVVAFAATHILFAIQFTRGSYVDGGPVDLGTVFAQTCLAVGACVSARRTRRVRLDGLAVLALPGAAAIAAVLLLLYGPGRRCRRSRRNWRSWWSPSGWPAPR